MVEGCAINGNPKPELTEMTGAFVVKFTRRPASEGEGGGISGGVTEGIDRLTDYIRNTPGRNVTEITVALGIPQKPSNAG